MEYAGTTFLSSFYLRSPAGMFKMVELIFGAGAWGPLAIDPVGRTSSSSNAFALWVTLSSWVLILISLLTGLLERVKVPKTEEEVRNYEAPTLGDMALNAVITIAYIPAIIVFAVFNFGRGQPPSNDRYPTFVLVMEIFTFLFHAANAVSIVTFFNIPNKRWEMKGRWIWQSSTYLNTRYAQQQTAAKPAAQYPPEQTTGAVYVNPPVSTANVTVQQDNDIYQDVDAPNIN